uniref:Uncharacterized protein AlNc14C69G4812 n=1 Tax=Albugo laibachii Nc14 TaxID=890382 RepID=F0WDU4_9STRA|nr:conserved hypothetical protein [Albugo laibachii Nc14]|eukprot:CCA19371.1 conserved hypothetical protein [Albugo laibachii Nc14]
MRVKMLKVSHKIRNAHASARNWLEKNCEDVPHQPVRFNNSISRMTRQAHAAHSSMLDYYQNQMISIQLPLFTKDLNPISSKRADLRELKQVEADSIKRIKDLASSQQVRFRPSVLAPLLRISSSLLGSGTIFFGAQVSKSINNGIKFAISDFCNDQIRELLEHFPKESALKEASSG